LNTRYGTTAVWCCSELFFHALLVATYSCGDIYVDGAQTHAPSSINDISSSSSSSSSMDGTGVGDGIAVDGPFFVAALTGINYAA
jgi:hypothetical protein